MMTENEEQELKKVLLEMGKCLVLLQDARRQDRDVLNEILVELKRGKR